MKNLRGLLAFLFLTVVAVLSIGVVSQSYTARSDEDPVNPTVITTRASIGSEQTN